MPLRIVCSACDTVMQAADELLGKKVKCKSCGAVVAVGESFAATADDFAEPARMPPPIRRRVRDDDDDDRSSPRPSRHESGQGSLLPLWIAGGAAAVMVLVVVLVLVLRTGSTPAPGNNQVAAAGDQPPVQNQQPAAQQLVNAPPEKRNAPPLIADPPAGETMKGEQIYQRLLQSTVWIVAEHKIFAANNNRPLAQVFDPPPPFQPPNFPRPPFGPKFGPPGFNPQMPTLPKAGQTSSLANTTWNGSETLPGFGKLTFRFLSNIQVVMVDAKETVRGSFVHTGNNVTITFGGGIIYNGRINGNVMSGSANNGQDNWTWSVSRDGTGAAPPAGAALPGGGIVAKSTGSGSVIDRKHRLIVTNVHVVGNNNDKVMIYFPDYDDKRELIVHSDAYKRKPGYTGRVVLKEERADLALVQLDRLPDGVQPLNVAKTRANPAQQVHSVGNPGASKGLWIYSPGQIRQVIPNEEWKIFDELDGKTYNYRATKIETNSAINPGDSGGPLVDDRCTLVGVAHGQDIVANNFSYFIEASEVRQLLEKYYRNVGDKLP